MNKTERGRILKPWGQQAQRGSGQVIFGRTIKPKVFTALNFDVMLTRSIVKS